MKPQALIPQLLFPLLGLLAAGCTTHRVLVPNDVISSADLLRHHVEWVTMRSWEQYHFDERGGKILRESDGRMVIWGYDTSGTSRVIPIDEVAEIGIRGKAVEAGGVLLSGIGTFIAIGILTQ